MAITCDAAFQHNETAQNVGVSSDLVVFCAFLFPYPARNFVIPLKKNVIFPFPVGTTLELLGREIRGRIFGCGHWLALKHTMGIRAKEGDEDMGLDSAGLGLEASPNSGADRNAPDKLGPNPPGSGPGGSTVVPRFFGKYVKIIENTPKIMKLTRFEVIHI